MFERVALSDGRELIYFGSASNAVDRRELPPPPAPAELRHDPLTGDWVAIAAHRQTRTFLPPAAECPLCPSTPTWSSEIPASSYDVVVFENRFPSFAGKTGRCEVVCFTPEHDSAFKDLSVERVRLVLEALAQRTAELSTRDGVEQVFCFENRGEEIGVTLHHPHGQIYAYPFITPTTRRYLELARINPRVYADMLERERREQERVIASNEHWTAFVPYAARWPYEIHLAPHRQVPDLAALTESELDACAPIWREVTQRLDGLFGTAMPYIAVWHQAPVHVDRELGYLHLRITSNRRAPGKLKYLAGSESAMGAWVNDIAPEDAAAALRGVSV